ncbi:nuclear cap-binding protein subunit 3 [Sigmodon hispidus]
MAAIRDLRVSVKAEAPPGPLALGIPSLEVESGLEHGEPEPMEVEEGELEIVPGVVFAKGTAPRHKQKI